MTTVGRYCKAYYVSSFRGYSNWTENHENLRKTKEEIDGQQVKAPRELTDEDILYLQENFTVTDGIFLDQNIVFDNVTPEWQEFCTKTLGFELPEEIRDDQDGKESDQGTVASVSE